MIERVHETPAQQHEMIEQQPEISAQVHETSAQQLETIEQQPEMPAQQHEMTRQVPETSLQQPKSVKKPFAIVCVFTNRESKYKTPFLTNL